jgi:hypothetical protein
MGGRIGIVSKEKQGSTFYFGVPLKVISIPLGTTIDFFAGEEITLLKPERRESDASAVTFGFVKKTVNEELS